MATLQISITPGRMSGEGDRELCNEVAGVLQNQISERADFLLARATGMKIEKVTDPLADEYAMWRRSVTK